MYIALDFDGTCVTHEFPKVGKDIGAVPVLKELVEKGHKLILHSMRGVGSDNVDYLYDAVKWFKDNGVKIKVISGDDPKTVSHIASEVGIEGGEPFF